MDKLLEAREGKALAEGQLQERDAERVHLAELPDTPIINGGTDDPLKVELVKKKE